MNREQEKRALQRRLESALAKKPATMRWGPTTEPVRVSFDRRTVARHNVREQRPLRVHHQPLPIFQPPKSILHPTPEWFTSVEPVEVSIIVPLFKSHEVVLEQTASWDLNCPISHEVIYVDDACPESSYLHALRSWESHRHLLTKKVGKIVRNSTNSGYAHACNTGAKFASGKYLLFLNADTRLTAGWIEPMVSAIQNPKIGIVGNMHMKVRQGHLTVDSAGSEWSWQAGAFEHIGRNIYNNSRLDQPMTLDEAPDEIVTPGYRDMVTGCCFLMTKELFSQLGGFDTEYRVGYWEDSELNMRVRKAGYKVWYEPASRIYHKVGHTGAGGHPYMSGNRDRFFNRWVHNGLIDQFVTNRRRTPFRLSGVYLKRDAAHGDVLVAASVAAAIKKQHPHCRVTFDTDIPQVLRGNPFIDHVVHNALPGPEYQARYNLNLAYEKKPHMHILDALAGEVNVEPDDCKLFFHTEPYDGLPKDYIVLAAGRTAWVGRNWDSAKFNDVSKGLIKAGHHVVAVGNAADANVPLDVSTDLRGKTSIYQLGHVIKNARAFVGIDSFPMWLAQTFNVPGVCFFGCVRPELRIIRPNMTGINDPQLPCIGCHHDQVPPAVGLTHCKVGRTYCEENVTTEKMLAGAIKILTGVDN